MNKKREHLENPGQDEFELEIGSGDPKMPAAEDINAEKPSPENGNDPNPHLSPEQISELQDSLDEVSAKADEYLDGWQRSRAEFANYKKRILKESSDIRQVARGEVIKIYLDVLDDLERALQEKPADSGDDTWANGIELIYQKLKTRLEAEGIRPMDALGKEFDPNIHEALMQEESDQYESGTIIEVMKEGYWLGDKVLRPALVRVAA